MRSWYPIWLIQLLSVTVKSNNNEGAKNKKLLPYFRRQVDENLGDLETRGAYSNDFQSQLALFHGDNIKEIFSENDEITEFSVSSRHPSQAACTKNEMNSIEEDSKLTDDIKGYRNESLNSLIDVDKHPAPSYGYELKKVKHSQMSENSLKKSEHKVVPNQDYLLLSSLVLKPSDGLSIEPKHKRSCIYCDNIMIEGCSNPKNELIPSVACERDGDQCYSLHTPFGVIDRGCYNVNRNLSIYVCACNLCNYISIAEMPYVFSNKREWIHNVVELSHSKNLRKSVFKDMACLKCEVNATQNNKNIIENENCLDGNVGYVPTEVCSENEVCAVKVVKGEGYVWRGCVKSPLYNYWWTLCDRDLCNYDNLISIYDYL